jgi:hypothetical protein
MRGLRRSAFGSVVVVVVGFFFFLVLFSGCAGPWLLPGNKSRPLVGSWKGLVVVVVEVLDGGVEVLDVVVLEVLEWVEVLRSWCSWGWPGIAEAEMMAWTASRRSPWNR